MINRNTIKKGAARILLCSALAISIISVPVHAAEEQMLTTGFEDNESFRLFKWRTLKALNTIRDAGLTPQAIVDNLFGSGAVTGAAQSAEGALSDYADGIGQEIADAVQEQTEAVVQNATDAATEAAKRQMNNWVDSMGESIGNALREMIDSILGGSDAG